MLIGDEKDGFGEFIKNFMISEIENVTDSRRIYDPFSRRLLEHL